MKPKRKVYIASGLPQGEINKRFNHLDTVFQRVPAPDSAEFVLVDLSNKPETWFRLLGRKLDFFIPSQNVPFLFVAFDKLDAAGFKELCKGLGCTPPVYKTPEDLLNALAWFESTMPFYNEGNRNDAFEKEVASVVLSKMKS